MRLIVQKKDLVPALTRAKGATDPRSDLLGKALLTVGGDGLRIAATDLFLTSVSAVPGGVKGNGSCAVNAATLLDAAKAMPDGEVSLSTEGGRIHLAAGKTRFKIAALDGDDFPMLPECDGEPEAFDARLLSSMISEVRYAVSSDDSRPHLAALLWEREGGQMRMVATDGHRLAKTERKADGPDFKVLIPRKGVDEAQRFIHGAAEAEVTFADWYVRFSRDGASLIAKLSDQTFPPYRAVIPKNQTKRAVVDRSLLLDAINRTRRTVGTHGELRVALSDGLLALHSERVDAESSDEVTIDYAGEALRIGFSADYFAGAVGSLTHDEIALELAGELDPMVVRPANGDDVLSVLMPMRI